MDKEEQWLKAIGSAREMILSNCSMISQVPVETFKEAERTELLLERLIDSDVPEPCTDEMDNVIATIRGTRSMREILVFAHMDHQPGQPVEPTMTITEDRIIGPGVADEALALGVLITLPDILRRLDLKLESDLVLLCSTRAHGRGDFGGIRHFMEKHGRTIDFAINLIGVPLGTVNYFSLSRTRCDISCQMEWNHGSPWGQMTNTSAVMVINEVMNKLFSIPLPRQPKTALNVGRVSGGERYSTISNRALLNIEMLSEDDQIMEELIAHVEDGCIDVGAKHGVEISLEFFGRHKAAGLSHSHPLVKSAVRIVDHLGYPPLIQYSNSELAVPLARSIPSLNLGITTGVMSGSNQRDVDIAPIPTGVLQIIQLLYAIDKGYCDE